MKQSTKRSLSEGLEPTEEEIRKAALEIIADSDEGVGEDGTQGEHSDYRTIHLFSTISSTTADIMWGILRDWQFKGPNEPITLLINSPGGYVKDMFSIIDAMESCSCPIITVGTGTIASAATTILAAGDKRYLTKYARVMLHSASGMLIGKVTDLQSDLAEVRFINELNIKLLQGYTKKTKKEIEALVTGPDKWLSSTQAVKLGLADKVIKDLI